WVSCIETYTISDHCNPFLSENFQVLRKIRTELNTVTGGNRSISLSDRDHTQYLNWTILEIHRLASILNLNLFRKTKENGVVGGHPVPKGTPIAAELSMIMKDEQIFEEANKFYPERYRQGGKTLEQQVIPFGLGKRSCIGENLAKAEIFLFYPERYRQGGKTLEQQVIPFGLGKRSCIGENLAKAEIFLILANLISRYQMFEDPEAPIDMTTSSPIGMMHRPKNFNIILKPTFWV
ncbi:hypothetical protein OSTOST_24672, partial [Ostertagia ostertagi]